MQPTSHQPSPERAARTRVRRTRAAASPPRGEVAVPAVSPVPVKRRRRVNFNRRLNKWEWLGFGVSVAACVSLWPLLLAAHGNRSAVSVQVEEKQTQLAALERQKNEEQGRLSHLKSEKGREQLLVERGFLKPGDRFLLFPEESTQPQSVATAAN